MARVRIEKIIDRLDSELRQALEDAVREVLPDAQFDSYELFRAFSRAVARKCSNWERVPDSCVDREQP